MDEICDGWHAKAAGDYGALDFPDRWQRDVTDWLRRDRNHPSVVIWSLGNETREARCDVEEFGKRVMQLCHALDPTRPVTSGSGHLTTGALDVHGGWPFRAFMGGAIDLVNFEKDLFYLYQSQWTSTPMVDMAGRRGRTLSDTRAVFPSNWVQL